VTKSVELACGLIMAIIASQCARILKRFEKKKNDSEI
jgi:hypothetical protein